MKNNKKGFISITIIYSFFILFISVMLLIMYNYISDRKMNNKIKSDLLNTLRDKSPDISISLHGSSSPHPSYNVNVLILDGGNGISSARYIWSQNPLADPYNLDEYPDSQAFSSYNLDILSPTTPGYYYLIVRACDANDHCKTAITNFFQVGDTYICVKATTLHNETCSNTDENGYCLGYGLEENSVINYGNFGSIYNAVLGSAYDCDVNGDGTYDPTTERFYYVSDYYDPITKEYDDKNAALVYYTNVHNGSPNNTHTCAYTTGSTMTPTTAVSELPTTTQWSNVNLLTETRDIMSTNGYDHLSRVFNYTGSVQTFKANNTGFYKIELWGAQGGSYEVDDEHIAKGGLGAYTSGVIHLEKDEILYVYVGGEGSSIYANESLSGGFNGGGDAHGQNARSRNWGSGGGATDVRLVAGSNDNTESLASRIMVAAGGGGAFYDGGYYNGGAGGSFTGLNGSQTDSWCYGEGGTQTSGGKVTTNCSHASEFSSVDPGSFGQGGNCTGFCAGGGGGYFGGGQSGHLASAGGGSSYVSGLVGTVSVKSSSDTTPKLDVNNEQCKYPTFDDDCAKHYSGKLFDEAQMIDGTGTEYLPNTVIVDGVEKPAFVGTTVQMPTHDGASLMTGNEGNGFAKITFAGPFTSATVDNAYSYTNKAARLLTYQELRNCIDLNKYSGLDHPQIGFNNKCSFLFENTKFANSSNVEGYLLESYYPEGNTVWVYDSSKNAVYSGVSKTTNNKYGVRPVIEIPKTRIQFN